MLRLPLHGLITRFGWSGVGLALVLISVSDVFDGVTDVENDVEAGESVRMERGLGYYGWILDPWVPKLWNL